MNAVTWYLKELNETMDYLPLDNIDQVIELLHEARLHHRQILIMGNGGSAATASHFVCDLLKNTRAPGIPGFRVIGLTDNLATITALANDEGYENVFSEQIENLGRPKDIVIAISTSGNSPNVLEGVKQAHEMGLTTIGFTGKDGGQLGDMVDVNVHIANPRADQTEDVHMILSHTITATLRDMALNKVASAEDKSMLLLQGLQEKFHDSKNLNGATHTNGKQLAQELDSTKKRSGLGTGSLNQVWNVIENITGDGDAIFDSQDKLDRVLNLIIDSIDATSGSFALLCEDQSICMVSLIYEGQTQVVDPKQMKELLRSGLAGWVLENQKSALIVNTRKDHRWVKRPRDGHMEEVGRSVISVPLTIQDQVKGVITVSRPETNPYSVRDMMVLIGIVAALASQMRTKSVRL